MKGTLDSVATSLGGQGPGVKPLRKHLNGKTFVPEEKETKCAKKCNKKALLPTAAKIAVNRKVGGGLFC